MLHLENVNKIVESLKENGHNVLRLSPYQLDLHAIEFVLEDKRTVTPCGRLCSRRFQFGPKRKLTLGGFT